MAESGGGGVRLHVGGLGESVGKDDLLKIFSPMGSVDAVEFVRTKGRSFAYIDFSPSSSNSLTKLFSTYIGCVWKGGRLRLEKAKEHYLARLKREWEEESSVSDNTIQALTDSTPSTHLNIFFPRLRKVKAMPLSGTGKHKYSFQRVPVPSLPKNFCDCEEHSNSLTPRENHVLDLEALNVGVNEDEVNVMNSVMNKLFQKNNIPTSEEQIPEEDNEIEADQDNLIINMGSSGKDMGNSELDFLSRERKSILNEKTACGEGNTKRKKGNLSDPSNKKQSIILEGTGRQEPSQSIREKKKPFEVVPNKSSDEPSRTTDIKRSSESISWSQKSSWKALMGYGNSSSFSVSSVLPAMEDDTACDAMEEDTTSDAEEDDTASDAEEDDTACEAKEDDTTSEAEEDDTAGDAMEDDTAGYGMEDDTTSDAVEDGTASDAMEDDTASDAVEDDTASDAVEDDTASDSVEDDTASDAVEDDAASDAMENDVASDAIEDDAASDAVSSDDSESLADTVSDTNVEDDAVSSDDREPLADTVSDTNVEDDTANDVVSLDDSESLADSVSDTNVEDDTANDALSSDDSESLADTVSDTNVETEPLDSVSNTKDAGGKDKLIVEKHDNVVEDSIAEKESLVSKDYAVDEEETGKGPLKASNNSIGPSWLQKASWTQLVKDTNTSSFSITQLFPDLSSVKCEPAKMINNGDGDGQYTNSNLSQSGMNKRKTPCSTGGLETAGVPVDATTPVRSLEEDRQCLNSTKLSEGRSLGARKVIRRNIGSGETCGFMRSSASLKEWAKAKKALSEPRRKKQTEE